MELPLKGNYNPKQYKVYFKDTGLLVASLDEKTQEMLINFLKEFHKSGKTLIIITHNKQLAKTLGTRFVYMNEEHELVEQ